jgi:hypothetical protein
MSRTGLVFAITALLSGCANLYVMSHVPLSTMSRLSSLRLPDIDPEQLRVGARLPVSLEPRPQGVKIRIDLPRGQGQPETQDFVLEPVTDTLELATLAAYERSGAHLLVYRLSPDGAGRLKGLLAGMTGPQGATGVSLSVGVDACHRSPLRAVPLLTTTLLRTNASGYFVLTGDLDLRHVISARDLAASIPPCNR